MTTKPLRAVTRKCAICQRKFRPSRRDAVYCSSACRQRAHRSRADLAEIDRRIDEARREYWRLIRLKGEAVSNLSRVVTEQAATVTPAGDVFMRGKHVGTTTSNHGGWTRWGLEAAGPPFDPPPEKRRELEIVKLLRAASGAA